MTTLVVKSYRGDCQDGQNCLQQYRLALTTKDTLFQVGIFS